MISFRLLIHLFLHRFDAGDASPFWNRVRVSMSNGLSSNYARIHFRVSERWMIVCQLSRSGLLGEQRERLI